MSALPRPRKRTFIAAVGMSALGQKRSSLATIDAAIDAAKALSDTRVAAKWI
jgi:hypothetical protein